MLLLFPRQLLQALAGPAIKIYTILSAIYVTWLA